MPIQSKKWNFYIIVCLLGIYSPRIWIIIVLRLGWTSVSTKRMDCQVPMTNSPSITGRVLSGGRNIERRCEWAFDGWWYCVFFGIRFSNAFLMSSSRFQSCSVRTMTPVAWGAKMWAIPFFTWDLETVSWTSLVRSMKSISPLVENSILRLKTLNGLYTSQKDLQRTE